MTASSARSSRSLPSAHPDRGSLRVQGWIYTAINPVLETCERALHLLEMGRLTWQRALADARGLPSARDHLPAAGQLNLRDLVRFVPDLEPLLVAQEEHVREAIEAAAEAHAGLVRHAGFRGVVLAERDRDPGLRRAAAEEVLAQVATLVINAEDELLEGPYRELWRQLRPQVAAFADADLLGHLRTARFALRRATEQLATAMADLRTRLCDEFDLPPGPITGPNRYR